MIFALLNLPVIQRVQVIFFIIYNLLGHISKQNIAHYYVLINYVINRLKNEILLTSLLYCLKNCIC